MQRDEAIRKIRSQSPDAFLEKARKRGWLCPACGNGAGRDGDGIVLNKKTTGSYKCFRCGLSGDIFDLIGVKFGLSGFNERLAKACEIYGISAGTDDRRPAQERRAQAAEAVGSVAAEQAGQDMSGYFSKCREALSGTDYLSARGITPEVCKRFGIGYDPEFDDGGRMKRPFPAVIFPTSDRTFEARNIHIAPGAKGFRYYKHGQAVLFNGGALSQEKERPLFIVEGIIDALSVIAAGGEAIGLSSADNYRLLLNELDRVTPSKPLILCFDRDEAGENFEEKLAEGLTKRNIPFLRASGDIIGQYHDPNDRLVREGDGLKEAVAQVYEQAAMLPDPAEQGRDEYIRTSAGRSVPALIEAIRANAQKPKLSTGFAEIDEALDGGLYTGLYFIGAVSSLGKTTLTLQIADNLAKQGRDVLFFSLEQSRFDLMSKSISRESFLCCRKNGLPTSNAKSNLAIMDGRRWAGFSETEHEVIRGAFKAYKEFAQHIFIHEGIGNISVAEIREKIKQHIAVTGNRRPVVFIDYVQILKAAEGDERSTDKQVVDHNVTALKQLSRDFDIPVCAVSSLNRENYRQKINMAAFKESGAIEYGSDVLIGLQFAGTGDSDFDVDEARAKDPKEIEFCILKNRNGRITPDGIPMLFYPVFNCFMDENGLDGEGGFVILTKEEEDDLPF